MYIPFREQQLRVTVRPTVVKGGEEPHAKRFRSPLGARVDAAIADPEREIDPDCLSHEFMRDQLRFYRGEDPEDT